MNNSQALLWSVTLTLGLSILPADGQAADIFSYPRESQSAD